MGERFDIDVGYNDPLDRRDPEPEYPPSPAEYVDPFTRCTTCGSYIPRTPPDEGVPMCSCGGRPKVWETPTE